MANFVVSPMKQEIELKAGEVYHGSILVVNPDAATEDFSFKTFIYPYSVSSDYTPNLLEETERSRIAKWTELETTGGTLKPSEKMRVNFTITVPETAPAGGQYLAIGVTSADEGEGMVQDIFEIASVVYASVEGETVHHGEILENSVSGFVTDGKPVSKVVVKNDGNVHETATTKIEVKNVFSGENLVFDDAGNVYDTIIMPETTREILRDINSVPQIGIFEVSQTVEYMGEETVARITMVICPIWFMALAALTIASIIGMICYTVHLKHKKSLIKS